MISSRLDTDDMQSSPLLYHGRHAPSLSYLLSRIPDDLTDLTKEKARSLAPYLYDHLRAVDSLAATQLTAVGSAPELPGTRSSYVPADLSPILNKMRDQVSRGDRSGTAVECKAMSEWGIRNDQHRTALVFAVAAVRLCPEAPEYSWRVGYNLRRMGHTSARGWYRRAIKLGTAHGSFEHVARSWLGLANLHRSVSQLKIAKECNRVALETARAVKIVEVEAESLHNLAVVCFDLGEIGPGWAYASKAYDAYGANVSGLAVLANDVAWHWMMQTGEFAFVLPLFRAALAAVEGTFNRLRVIGNIAQAAGGAGERQMLLWAIERTYELAPKLPEQYGIADAMIGVARGAASAGMTDVAREAAEAAVHAANSRNEEVSEAESVLMYTTNQQRFAAQAVQRAESVLRDVARSRPTQRHRPLRSGPATAELARGLITNITRALQMSKLHTTLRDRLQESNLSSKPVLIGIECIRSDVTRVEDLLASAGGDLEISIPLGDGGVVYGYLPVTKVSSLLSDPAVIRVSPSEFYDVL